MNVSSVETFYNELSGRKHDLKAEAILCQAVENGFSPEEFIIFLSAFFEREFSKDIAEIEIINKEEWKREFIELQLSRPGFYDLLPEGLFFQPNQKDYFRGAADATEMALQYKKDKAIEKDVRKFFQPYEHEFFYQQLLIEKAEMALIKLFNKPVSEIWDFPGLSDKNLAYSLLLLLPYAHQIAGNVPLMEKALQLTLGEQVKIEKGAVIQNDVKDEAIKLGNFYLGTNMVCGDQFLEESLVLEYKIGPLKKYKLTDFLYQGTGKVFIDNFNRFFSPVDVDIQITIEIDKLHREISLNDEYDLILGYSTIL